MNGTSMYQVVINIKTPGGMLEIGQYYLGTDKSFAEHTFGYLTGNADLAQYPFIRLDLIHMADKDALPECVKTIGCDLNQYTHNCAILTREVFRHFMFEGGG